MQMGFYFDQTRCIDCFACCVACKDWHDVPAGPAKWLRIETTESGEYPHPSVDFLFVPCYHCAEPSCLSVCPVDAIRKGKTDGVVLVDREACLGRDACGLCLEACPYKAPQFGAEENAKMQKCDFCYDRLQEGRKPICVGACPTRALDSGSMDELHTKYGDECNSVGFVYSPECKPSIVFRREKQ